MKGPQAPTGGDWGVSRDRFMALVVVPALIAVAICGVITNIATRGRIPQLPLSGIIGPARIAELRFAQIAAKGDVSPQLAARGKRAAARDVLAYEPFLFAAATDYRSTRSTGTARSLPLLREVIRRHPRSRASRVMIMRHAVGAGDLAEAIGQLAILHRLNDDIAIPLLRGIGQSASTIRAVDEAADALADHPELFDDYVSGFTAAPKAAAVVTRLAERLPPAATANPRLKDALVARLVQDKNYPEARRIAMNAKGTANTAAGVIDPGFAKSKSTPPFGWAYAQSEIGVAERTGPGDVFVDYYGRTPGSLLEQLITLSPGAYRVEMAYALSGPPSGTVALEVGCTNSNLAALAKMRLDETVKARGTATIPFTVPPQGCSAQTLALVGLLSDGRAAQQLTVFAAGC